MNARLNILIGMQVNLVQSIPVISYSDKRVASCGREKKGEGEGEAVKYEFNVTLQEKKKRLGI